MVWLESNLFFLPKKLEKGHFFPENLAGTSTLIQWTPRIVYISCCKFVMQCIIYGSNQCGFGGFYELKLNAKLSLST